MKTFFSMEQLDGIADDLVDKGYAILNIKDLLIDALAQHVVTLKDFKAASIGRDGFEQENLAVRCDKTLWLDNEEELDAKYLSAMQGLQEGVNSRLYMGLHYHEAHYAHYSKGDFYKKHLDAFRGKSSRKLTTVLYLNKTWSQEDEGALVIYDGEDHILEEVPPTLGRMVIFLSDTFPHEVLSAGKDRYSIAGWFRID